jgi:hypothetical protein
MRSRLASLSYLACLLSPALSGQVPDTTPFHRSQWGVDFQIGGGFASAGAIHFTSSTRALAFDITGQYRYSSATETTAGSAHGDAVNTTVSLGSRSYHAMGAHVVRWTTLGLSVLYSYQQSTQDSVTAKDEGVGGGVFANLGATWLVTPHLGLGAQWQANATYTHYATTGPYGSGSSNAVTVGFARITLTGQIFF